MHHVELDDTERHDLGPGVALERLRDPLGATDVSINRYRVASATRLPWGLHTHMDQEELFVVLEGELTFETLEGHYTVDAGEAIRFAPGEFQAARNDGDDAVTYLAIGAPPDSEDVRIPRPCPSCGADALRLTGGASDGLSCVDCGTAVDGRCEACGEADRTVRLTDDGEDLVDVCRNCGETVPIERD